MNEIIRKRKSIRKYDPAVLNETDLEKVREQIGAVKPLYPDIRFSIKIETSAKSKLKGKAPHNLVFYSEIKKGAYENIGFIGQQMDLFFSGAGFGSCWLGMAKPEEKAESGMSHVICMAFGRPDEPLHRSPDDFKRKPLLEISEGFDERLEAARLAPSGINVQNWFFVAENDEIHCYRKKGNPLLGLMAGKLGNIDMGIAICHIAEESDSFSFGKKEGVAERKKCTYIGTVGR